MSAHSKIEWTDRSDWNPVRGCTRVSPGCGGPGDHGGCYAEGMAARFSKPGMWGHGFAEMQGGKPRWTGKVSLIEQMLLKPLSWKKPCKVFANSTSDFFHESLSDSDRDKILTVMALCPHLTFQVLTKRPERALEYFRGIENEQRIMGESPHYAPHRFDGLACQFTQSPCASGFMEDVPWPLPNVWLGASVERQEEANERIPLLIQTPAAIRFLSCEPMLGLIDLKKIRSRDWLMPGETETEAFSVRLNGKRAIDWVICGGESGPRARPMHPEWARSLRDQCAAARVPFFFKQWGEWLPGEANNGQFDDRQMHAYRRCDNYSYDWPNAKFVENFGTHTDNFSGDLTTRRVGKLAAGRMLDCAEYSEFPIELAKAEAA